MIQQQAIIFDLGGVLLNEAEANLHKAQSDHLQKILDGNLPKIRIFNRAFEFASFFCEEDCKTRWILGITSGNEIVSKIKENIDKQKYDNFFENSYERNLIKYGISFVLLPNLLVNLTEIIPEGLEFVKKCKLNGIRVSIISNWDPESFVLLKSKIPEFFNFFEEDHIVIPQMVGKIKPEQEIYDYTIKKINCDPSQVFFVDDSKINIKGAQTYGIKAIHHKNWVETKSELAKHGFNINMNCL